ncbi:hypothetical protein MXS87_20605 [Escherichia coli]|nr:hypothetical protein [Escherichia coli]
MKDCYYIFCYRISTTSFAAKISLETAGLCYEATRQSTKMAMLLDPDAAEYKHLNNNTKELFGTLSGAWRKGFKENTGCTENRLDNVGMEGRMVKFDGYREMNRISTGGDYAGSQ